MSGQQLAGKLAAVYPEMKVLFVSGYSQSAVFHRDVPSLNRAFLQKPFSLPVLAEKSAASWSHSGKLMLRLPGL
jgi:FixJ family two-component response regulator